MPRSMSQTREKPSSIANVARKLAWPVGTKYRVYKWPGGSATSEFKTAKSKVYTKKELKGRTKHFKAGASCDMFTATCIRYSGYDVKFPPGIPKQIPYMQKHSKKWKQVKYNRNNLLPGDIMFYRKSKGKGNSDRPSHVFIYIGNGYIAQASATDYFGRVQKLQSESFLKKKTWVKVFRPIKDNGTSTFSSSNSSKSTSSTGDDDSISEDMEDMYWEDTGGPLVLENEISQLYSTDNYKWLEADDSESEESRKRKERQDSVRTYLQNLQVSGNTNNVAPSDVIVSYSRVKPTREVTFKLDNLKSSSTQSLISYPNLVEAPTIELSFNGVIIGGYNNTGDKYPNYISSMTVTKINGRINNYNINLVYQVRAGEDPNFIDKLLSKTGYLKPLKILYGDSNSPGLIFKQESAIITDVKSRDNVASSSITYTIQAISSVTIADQAYFTFSEKTGKPSTLINDLLYNSGQVSTQLLNAFPSMKDRSFVSSNNLIPSNDVEMRIGGMADVSAITYLSHLVSCMSSLSNNSSYFLSFNDNANGSYFKISEVCPIMDNNVLYEIDVGYPGNNFVTNFQLCDNIYWPLVYDYNGSIPKWDYSIDNSGNEVISKSNSLYTDNKFLSQSIINTNWWKSLTEFPISAKITLKGLTVPVMLMTYIRINTLFYGQKDIASGIYVVTDQEDSISGNGYSTTLTLLRVSD